MKSILHTFILSCNKATFLIEKSQEKPLSFLEKIQLKMHTNICEKCAFYQKQSNFIASVIKGNKQFIQPNEKLSESAKKRIQELINNSVKSES